MTVYTSTNCARPSVDANDLAIEYNNLYFLAKFELTNLGEYCFEANLLCDKILVGNIKHIFLEERFIMVSDSQISTPSIVLLETETPTWAESIQSYLTDHGYELSIISSDLAKELIEAGKSPDAILSLSQQDGLAFFRVIREKEDDNTRPVLVLVTDGAIENFPHEIADIVLPPNPNYIDHQLKSILRLRLENAKLRQENAQLSGKFDTLKTESDQQKRSINEIEILKNAIVRNVSHELKTPLLQVKSAVSLLAEDAKDQELIEYAKNATARLETLVKNITLLGSSLDVHPGPVIIRDAMEYAKRNLGRVWEHRQDISRISIDLESGIPPVEADKQGLNTILQLLMDNALKFSQGKVEVSAKRDGNHVKFTIRDHGIGIAQDELDKIFEIFYQVDASSTRRYGGTGVGLAIVRLILDRHNTFISVNSTQGEGSTFSFVLPIISF